MENRKFHIETLPTTEELHYGILVKGRRDTLKAVCHFYGGNTEE
jgi:hypothetical protein